MIAAHYERLLHELGFTTVVRGRRLQHPSHPPALTYHCTRTGEVYFTIHRKDQPRFAESLWQRTALRRKQGRRPDTLCLQPVAGQEAEAFRDLLAGAVHDPEAADNAAEEELRRRRDVLQADKQQLLKARRGQGEFRRQVERVEQSCRLTGVLDRRHLRARHIKPWRDSTDREKLDGNNGLLLSPHIDHLFERGYLSFDDDGRLLVSRYLNPGVLDSWGVGLALPVRTFNAAQRRFLAYHREHLFERQEGGRRRRN